VDIQTCRPIVQMKMPSSETQLRLTKTMKTVQDITVSITHGFSIRRTPTGTRRKRVIGVMHSQKQGSIRSLLTPGSDHLFENFGQFNNVLERRLRERGRERERERDTRTMHHPNGSGIA